MSEFTNNMYHDVQGVLKTIEDAIRILQGYDRDATVEEAATNLANEVAAPLQHLIKRIEHGELN